MQFHTTPRRNGVKMVYGKSDCRRENDTLLPPPKIEWKLWWNTQPSAWPSNGYADGCFIFCCISGRIWRKISPVRRLAFLPILPLRLVITAFRVPIKGGILPLQGFAWIEKPYLKSFVEFCILSAICTGQRPLRHSPSGHHARSERPPNQMADLGLITTV